ncbi:phosphatidylinositol-specific phospholipase C/glycerophosphodiester phosphodiesterase family protein [Mucilaginibacter gossypii]|uniref:phosphatidylinositol-specific phospholipase C/glycerophosphodiester phosphodiesterase family protein n=1 Tax=Mucilaginibacter gossypii TaxID=551996 RepID=UPI000DCDF903|nr:MULTISPECIES: phosphatidylinositol-specific phospholipase C/glycerophosphodiester phosphodiesterase family protein [Mucilaginibacter]QTE35914.1 phosphatidylinositol-specific phospholipase C/glycerophosphodiester phosphodiesterase family protein [Mucilaginibacter gossypii]RAV54719.1 hypothetical protein DIU36_20290 [Mucilaginibacter rubeus]
MQAAFCHKHLKFLFFVILTFRAITCQAQNSPLSKGFAHNDYWHNRPLYDALDNGFQNVEADIYLRDDELLVAHMLPAFQKKRTLEQLYLKPLFNCYEGKNREVVYPLAPVTLMIDIKSDAEKTYAKLAEVLKRYAPMLSSYNDGEIIEGKVTIVITGNKPYKMLQAQKQRYAFIDEDLMQVHTDTLSNTVYKTASCKYSRLISWTGKGPMPEDQRQLLRDYVAAAHHYKKRVRLWASPENKEVWKALLECEVDLINTDKLAELREFLMTGPEPVRYAKVNTR